MTDTNPQFGFRMEGISKGSVTEFVSSPYYFTKHRGIDKFNEREDIKIPLGKDAAGVWFFNNIGHLSDSFIWDSVSNPRIITRINIAELRKDLVVEDRAMGTQGKASIAISFYDPPATKSREENISFVKSLVVPDNLIDVWSGERWLKKNAVGLLDIDKILCRAEWGRYAVPSAVEVNGSASNQPIVHPDNSKDWRLPPPPKSIDEDGPLNGVKAVLKLYRKARHAIVLHKLQQEEKQHFNWAEWHHSQDESFKNGGDNAYTMHSMQAICHQVDAKRTRHEQTVLLSGKTFWQLNDINAWANLALRLERIDDANLLYRELPQSALFDLRQHMKEIRHQAMHARLEAATSTRPSHLVV